MDKSAVDKKADEALTKVSYWMLNRPVDIGHILVIFQGSGDTIFTKLVTPAGVTIKAGDIYKVTILFKTLLGILRARPWQIQGSQLFHSLDK